MEHRILSVSDCLAAAGELWPVPDSYSDKYSGVVSIYAGSEQYPGAAVLTTKAAVCSTSPMVRFMGADEVRDYVIRATPEVVVGNMETVGTPQFKTHAWVLGPGIDAHKDSVLRDVEKIIYQQERLVIDASALGMLAEHRYLREAVSNRNHQGRVTILTPHAGEYASLARCFGNEDYVRAARVDQPLKQRVLACQWLAERLHCIVLLKGRQTVIADRNDVWVVDTGHSWLATPGSGDILSGMLGSVLASLSAQDSFRPVLHAVLAATAIHADAAERSARTAQGHAPTWASKIIDFIPDAIAGARHSAFLQAQSDKGIIQ